MIDDDGLDELDQMLAEAVEAEREAGELKRRKKELSRLPVAEREAAMKEYARLSDARLWVSRANVALFHSQHCTCGKDHVMFVGWYAEFRHKTDPHARKLTKGKSIEHLPERMEIQFQGQAEMCLACVDGKVGLVGMIDQIEVGEEKQQQPKQEAA